MSWQLWTVIAVMALGTLLNIGNIGKQREPITPAVAVTVVLVNGSLVGLILWGAS